MIAREIIGLQSSIFLAKTTARYGWHVPGTRPRHPSCMNDGVGQPTQCFSQRPPSSLVQPGDSQYPSGYLHRCPFVPRNEFLLCHLAPQSQQLMVQRNLNRTYVSARTTQGTSVGQRMISLRITHWAQYTTDRPWNSILIAVTAATAVDRTSIHTRSTAYTLERLEITGTASQSRSSIVHNDNV